MRVHLQGGFGEKGRTSVLVGDGQTTIMLDAGIMVGAPPGEYHPKLACPAAQIDAVILTHAHEDHIGALSWLFNQGFEGAVYMTAETRADMAQTLTMYARPEDLTACPPSRMDITLFRPTEVLTIATLQVQTGNSGHVAGGVWMRVSDRNGHSLLYAGDVVPDSPVYPMTPFAICDMALLDASYGDDAVPAAMRKRRIRDWVAARPQGCLLPTPLSGRSLELMALLAGKIAIHHSMRAPLRAQIAALGAMSDRLAAWLDAAQDWHAQDRFPALALLVHDGMGSAGPSAQAIPRAIARGHPVLFTGHLPNGSPGEILVRDKRADWQRLPTHPTMPENRTLWEIAGRPRLLGHSCTHHGLGRLKAHLPALEATARTGQSFDI